MPWVCKDISEFEAWVEARVESHVVATPIKRFKLVQSHIDAFERQVEQSLISAQLLT